MTVPFRRFYFINFANEMGTRGAIFSFSLLLEFDMIFFPYNITFQMYRKFNFV